MDECFNTIERHQFRKRCRVDLATVIGLVGAAGIVTASMLLGGGVLVFINVPSILVVFIGTMFVVLMKFNMNQYLGSFKLVFKAFLMKPPAPDDLIKTIVDLADTARKSGLLALESVKVDNPFLQKGIGLLVDGHDPEIVRNILNKDVRLTVERHEIGVQIFKATGDVGPAMGMIGTLVGLVLMLSNMDDPKSIGPAMAVALLTTLYGAMLANMFAIPVADKLSLRSGEEKLVRSLIIDGLLGIQAGQNPRVIEELLRNYIENSKRPSGDA